MYCILQGSFHYYVVDCREIIKNNLAVFVSYLSGCYNGATNRILDLSLWQSTDGSLPVYSTELSAPENPAKATVDAGNAHSYHAREPRPVSCRPSPPRYSTRSLTQLNRHHAEGEHAVTYVNRFAHSHLRQHTFLGTALR